MEFSYYGWLWIALGAIFVPVEVIAYLISITKIIIDRSRIKKLNTGKRQTRLNGVPSGKKPNILVVNDEERAKKFLRNGIRKGDSSKRSAKPSSTLSDSRDGGADVEQKQNGGHDVRVTVEHNLVAHNLNGKLSALHYNRVDKDYSNNSFGKITEAGMQVTTIQVENVAEDSSLSKANLNKGDLSSSELSGATFNNSDASLPDNPHKKQQKQRPPKPKRSQTRTNHNKRAGVNENENSLSSSGENVAGNDVSQDMVTKSNCNNRLNLRSHSANSIRRLSHSSTSDTDHDVSQVSHVSPNRSLSQDNLCYPACPVHLNKNCIQCMQDVTNVLGGHTNVAFEKSFEEIKTNS